MSRRFVYYGAGVAADNLLLDSYPAVAAYSLRKLRTAYTGAAIRVRRGSDNSEKDIGFSGNDLDTTSLLSFVGAGDGFVATIYNQGISNINRDAIRTSLSEQQRIVKDGVVNLENGKPALDSYPEGVGKPGYLMNAAVASPNIITIGRIKYINTINYMWWRDSSNYGGAYGGTFNGVDGISAFKSGNIFSLTGEDTNQHLANYNINATDVLISKDGQAFQNLGNYGDSNFEVKEVFGRDVSSVVYFLGNSQEIIMFDDDQSANKSIIENNINAYYNVY